MNSIKNEVELTIEEPLSDLMASCEHFCVVYCCGIYAFDPGKESVGLWVAGEAREKVQLARTQIRALIERVQMLSPEGQFGLIFKGQLMSVKWTEGIAWLIEWETSLNQCLNEA
jgi:hypothetical protein